MLNLETTANREKLQIYLQRLQMNKNYCIFLKSLLDYFKLENTLFWKKPRKNKSSSCACTDTPRVIPCV